MFEEPFWICLEQFSRDQYGRPTQTPLNAQQASLEEGLPINHCMRICKQQGNRRDVFSHGSLPKTDQPYKTESRTTSCPMWPEKFCWRHVELGSARKIVARLLRCVQPLDLVSDQLLQAPEVSVADAELIQLADGVEEIGCARAHMAASARQDLCDFRQR